MSLFADLVEFLSTPHSRIKKFVSCSLEHNARNLLGEASTKQIIHETETVCGVLAHFLWLSIVQGRKSFLYVDNEGTKSMQSSMRAGYHNEEINGCIEAGIGSKVRSRSVNIAYNCLHVRSIMSNINSFVF